MTHGGMRSSQSAMLLRDAALRSIDIMMAFPAKSGLQVAMSDLIAQAELSLRVWKEIVLVSVDPLQILVLAN